MSFQPTRRKLGQALSLTLSSREPLHYTLYSTILHLCTDLNSKKSGQLIHSRIISNGLPSNTTLDTRLIIFYAKLGELGSARKVFDRMSERSVVTWTALISGYSRSGDCEEALRVFSAMRGEGVRANQYTYGSVLSACTRLEWGRQVQGCVEKSRFVDDLFVQSALVGLHSKGGKMEDACCVFGSMERRDLVSWNTMIGGYAAQGMSDKAILMFRWMLREGMLPDSFTFGSIFRAITGIDGLTKVNILHGYIFQFGFGSDKFLHGSLIDAYVKCGRIDIANKVYNNMPTKDVVSCTALIKGYASEGTNCTAALKLFNDVRRTTSIDAILLCCMFNICAKTASLSLGRQSHAYALKHQDQNDLAMGNALIDMYSKSGAIKDAKRAFDEMDEKNIISWTSLIDGYSKNGYGHEAIALYTKMEDEGLKPNDVTFLSLLFACSHNGLTKQGWECFSNMVNKHGILPRAEHYSCLVDIFARAGRLEEAYALVCEMSGDVDGSFLGALLGACSVYGDMNIGEVVARRLLEVEPENLVGYVVLSGIYAGFGLWDRAGETRALMEKKIGSKRPGYSLYQTSEKEVNLPRS